MLNTADVLNLTGKVAVVTGGASGIGLATAELLASFGAHAVLLDINDELGERAVAGIRGQGGTASYYRCDVSSSEDCKQVAAEMDSACGRIDILFNNAGIIRRRPSSSWRSATGILCWTCRSRAYTCCPSTLFRLWSAGAAAALLTPVPAGD